jgi:hypothetical protein
MHIIQFATAHHQNLRKLSKALRNDVENYVVQHVNVDQLISSGVSSSTKGVNVDHRGDARGKGDAVPKQTGAHAHVDCIGINDKHL